MANLQNIFGHDLAQPARKAAELADLCARVKNLYAQIKSLTDRMVELVGDDYEIVLQRKRGRDGPIKDRLLKTIHGMPDASLSALAYELSPFNGERVPRWRVQRLTNRLQADGLLKPYYGGKRELTAKGVKAVIDEIVTDDDFC